jgi:hypothetical protein
MNAYNFINKRDFSSSGLPSTPIYTNADTQKLSIIKENKGKAGYIYEKIPSMVICMLEALFN